MTKKNLQSVHEEGEKEFDEKINPTVISYSNEDRDEAEVLTLFLQKNWKKNMAPRIKKFIAERETVCWEAAIEMMREKVQNILDDTANGEENNDFEAAKTMHNGLKSLLFTSTVSTEAAYCRLSNGHVLHSKHPPSSFHVCMAQ